MHNPFADLARPGSSDEESSETDSPSEKDQPVREGAKASASDLSAGKKARLERQRDRVTIGLYVEVRGFQSAESSFLVGEVQNVINIKTKLSLAADERPLDFILSVNLVPDWEYQDYHESPSYKTVYGHVFEFLRQKLRPYEVKVEDFYQKLTLSEWPLAEEELGYLKELSALGSNADMIKTHAIVCEENRNRRHLQMDSNTRIYSFSELYKLTFGHRPPKDAFNAILYSGRYVGVHNKLVFTVPDSRFVAVFLHGYEDYFLALKDKADNSSEKTRNSIYPCVFAPATAHTAVQLAEKIWVKDTHTSATDVTAEGDGAAASRQVVDDREWSTIKANPRNARKVPRYAAKLERGVMFRLTKVIIPAVSMSWVKRDWGGEEQILMTIPPVQVGDARCNYQCFHAQVRKYTFRYGGANHVSTKKALINLSYPTHPKKCQLGLVIIREFFNHVRANHPQLLHLLMRTIGTKSESPNEGTRTFWKLIDRLQGDRKPTAGAAASARTPHTRHADSLANC